jgi:hypothetical protein
MRQGGSRFDEIAQNLHDGFAAGCEARLAAP